MLSTSGITGWKLYMTWCENSVETSGLSWRTVVRAADTLSEVCFAFIVSCETTNESDILVHTRGWRKKKRERSFQVSISTSGRGLNVSSSAPLSRWMVGFHSVRWWRIPLWGEQRTGRAHCVMFHLGLQESKHHLRTAGVTPAQQTLLSMSNIHTWNVRDPPLALDNQTLTRPASTARWNDTMRQLGVRYNLAIFTPIPYASVWTATLLPLLGFSAAGSH